MNSCYFKSDCFTLIRVQSTPCDEKSWQSWSSFIVTIRNIEKAVFLNLYKLNINVRAYIDAWY